LPDFKLIKPYDIELSYTLLGITASPQTRDGK
jgi:hypothetical protein